VPSLSKAEIEERVGKRGADLFSAISSGKKTILNHCRRKTKPAETDGFDLLFDS
jgi:hypothetical protein